MRRWTPKPSRWTQPIREKARVVREELLFYTRQKVTDLLTQMAVNIQGYLALDLLRKNNFELMKGVDRATTTTVAALRTAVMVAQALINQKLVLDQISALNTTTGNLIETTSEMLQEADAADPPAGGFQHHRGRQVAQAFENVYQTMDAIADVQDAGRWTRCRRQSTCSPTEVTKSRRPTSTARGSKQSSEALAKPAGDVKL